MVAGTRDLAVALSTFEGIGPEDIPDWKRAMRERGKGFLRTPRSEKLHRDIISLIQQHAATGWARERLSLLVPLRSREDIHKMRELVSLGMESVGTMEPGKLTGVKKLMKQIAIPGEPVPRFDGTVGIVAENDDIYTHLIDSGLNRWYPIYMPASLNPDTDLLLYVYDTGTLDINGDNVLMLPADSPREAIVPDSLLQFYAHNRAILEAAGAIQGLRGRESVCGTVLGLMDSLPGGEKGQDLGDAAADAVRIANDHFTAAVKEVRLEGGAILEMLGSGIPEVLRSRLRDAERAGTTHFREKTGFHLSLNTTSFPFTVDRDDLDELGNRQRMELRKRDFRERAKLARALRDHRQPVIREIESLLLFDLLSAIGDFVTTFDMVFPEMGGGGKAMILQGAAHIGLMKRTGCVRVDYHLGDAGGHGGHGEHGGHGDPGIDGPGRNGDDPGNEGCRRGEKNHRHHGNAGNVAILTGANSGGKTTLLETIAQTFILARMGFPVLCRRAVLPDVEELFFHSRKAALNAGAFESFLRSFIPVVKRGKRKLILADELEAVTELDAGARIIASILGRIGGTDSWAVVVSHMSEEIGKRIPVRIDGIEAKGLDENLDLIVDRNPRIGYRARSTPELIVQRLHTLSSGEEREI